VSFDRKEALDFMRRFTKEASASSVSGRPGQGLDIMGMGMAPWPIKQQPVTGATTQSLLSKQLVNYAAKSQQKKMTGSINASGNRQMAKKTGKGELLGKTDTILSDPNEAKTAAVKKRERPREVKNLLSRLTGGDIAIAGGISGAGTGLATYDQLGKFNELLKGHEKALKSKARSLEGTGKLKAETLEKLYKEKAEKLPRLLRWYAKRKGMPDTIDLKKHLPEIEKQIPRLTMSRKAVTRTAMKSGAKVGTGAVLSLLLARALSRKAEKSRKLTNITNVLDGGTVKLSSAEYLEKEARFAAAARMWGWGKNLLRNLAPRVAAPEAALPHAGKVFQSAGAGTSEAVNASTRLRNALSAAKGKFWAKGTGRKNVYRKLDDAGKPLLDDAGKEVQFLSSKGMFRAPKDWQKVKRWDQTGGWIQQGVKGLARHGSQGAVGGYGLSWALNQDAKWNDQKRIDMALGGALLYPSMKFSNMPASLAAAGAQWAAPNTLGGVIPGAFTSAKRLWDTKGGDGTRFSKMQNLSTSLAAPQLAARKATETKAKRLNANARKIQRELAEAKTT